VPVLTCSKYLLDLSIDALLDIPAGVLIVAGALLDVQVEFLLPDTVQDVNRANNTVNAWLDTLSSPPAANSLQILATVATKATPLDTYKEPKTLGQAPEVTYPAPNSDGTLLDTDYLETDE
jgi:hypothetical protein